MYLGMISRYVFTKNGRISGEQVDVSEDINNFDVSIVDCGSEMEEEGNDEEYVVESEESEEDDYIVESDENEDEWIVC